MSKITAINIIIGKENQLRKYKEACVSSIDIDEIFEWLNNIKNELEDWTMNTIKFKARPLELGFDPEAWIYGTLPATKDKSDFTWEKY